VGFQFIFKKFETLHLSITPRLVIIARNVLFFSIGTNESRSITQRVNVEETCSFNGSFSPTVFSVSGSSVDVTPDITR